MIVEYTSLEAQRDGQNKQYVIQTIVLRGSQKVGSENSLGIPFPGSVWQSWLVLDQ